jgi:hypothetical protein
VQADKLTQLVASFRLMKGTGRAGVPPLPVPARANAAPAGAVARTQKLTLVG